MKEHNIDIRQLRDSRKLKRDGKTVDLRERDKVIARIVPPNTAGSNRGSCRISPRAARTGRLRTGATRARRRFGSIYKRIDESSVVRTFCRRSRNRSLSCSAERVNSSRNTCRRVSQSA